MKFRLEYSWHRHAAHVALISSEDELEKNKETFSILPIGIQWISNICKESSRKYSHHATLYIVSEEQQSDDWQREQAQMSYRLSFWSSFWTDSNIALSRSSKLSFVSIKDFLFTALIQTHEIDRRENQSKQLCLHNGSEREMWDSTLPRPTIAAQMFVSLSIRIFSQHSATGELADITNREAYV